MAQLFLDSLHTTIAHAATGAVQLGQFRHFRATAYFELSCFFSDPVCRLLVGLWNRNICCDVQKI
jgi:hypothetical protein